MNDAKIYARRFADAVAEVVEAARWDAHIKSIRELARLSGMTHTSLNKRHTKSTPYTVRDLAAMAPALKVEPMEILRRARERVGDAVPTPDPALTVVADDQVITPEADPESGSK